MPAGAIGCSALNGPSQLHSAPTVGASCSRIGDSAREAVRSQQVCRSRRSAKHKARLGKETKKNLRCMLKSWQPTIMSIVSEKQMQKPTPKHAHIRFPALGEAEQVLCRCHAPAQPLVSSYCAR